MNVSEEDLEYINTNLEFYDITDSELKENLLDHICTSIENSNEHDFQNAYNNAIRNFGGYGALQIMQHKIREKQLIRSILFRKKIWYMLSSFNLMLLAAGFLFKLNQWPYSTFLLATGFLVLVFASIPFYFYERYKFNYQKTIQLNK